MNQEELKQRLIDSIIECDMENYVLEVFTERPSVIRTAEIIADHLIANGVTIRERGEWIPVTERLPEETQDFLVVLDNGNIDIRLFNSKAEPWITYSLMLNKFIVLDSRREWTVEYKVTHWMPIPEPPEAEKGGAE